MRRKMKKLKAALSSEKSNQRIRRQHNSLSSDSSSNSDFCVKDEEIPMISKKYFREEKIEIGITLFNPRIY